MLAVNVNDALSKSPVHCRAAIDSPARRGPGLRAADPQPTLDLDGGAGRQPEPDTSVACRDGVDRYDNATGMLPAHSIHGHQTICEQQRMGWLGHVKACCCSTGCWPTQRKTAVQTASSKRACTCVAGEDRRQSATAAAGVRGSGGNASHGCSTRCPAGPHGLTLSHFTC